MMFILTALICMAMTAQAQTVYVSTGSDAVAYHKNKSCSYLKNSKDVKSISTAEAKKMGRHECQRCYGTATATKKTATATKKTTTATKKTTTATKKTTTAKKSTPARDEKGRFVKKADTEKKATTTKKSTPARDEKGRFIKTTDQKTTKKAAETVLLFQEPADAVHVFPPVVLIGVGVVCPLGHPKGLGFRLGVVQLINHIGGYKRILVAISPSAAP